MNNRIPLVCLLGLGICSASAYGGGNTLLSCRFPRSLSVSFGYGDVYTITGDLKNIGISGSSYYEVDGTAEASVDQTASTNFPGKHLGDTAVNLNLHPSGGEVMLDIRSSGAPVNGEDFHILVFSGAGGSQDAYLIISPTSYDVAGECDDIDPRLQP